MPEEGLSRRQRIAQIWEAVRESQALWAWGDDQGWTPWTDSLGHGVVPLWISADQATEENQDDSEPGERPLFFSLDYVLVRIPAWREAGIAETGLQSEDGRRRQRDGLGSGASRARSTSHGSASSPRSPT